MNVLIGDIGNTNTKVCLVNINNFRIKKIIYLKSHNILSNKFLRTKFKKIIKTSKIKRVALFSSVVPRYYSSLKNFLTVSNFV